MGFMGSLVGAVGGNAGGAGLNYQAGQAPITPTFNPQQLQTAYGQTQTGLQEQQDFLNALQAQQGISNQSNVFQQQQALANQLQGVANGTGPNPAQAALNQATSANIAQQAALMAGQRGAGANVGLMARQAAQQGGALQQQAVGQGATLQAQQQLAAMNALQGQQANMANLATTQVGQQAGALQGYNALAQNEQQNLLNAAGQYNQAQVGSMGSQNAANSSIANTAAGQQGKLAGGIISGISGGMIPMAKGGAVPHYAAGTVNSPVAAPSSQVQVPQYIQQQNYSGPSSNAGRYLKNKRPLTQQDQIAQQAAPQKDSLEQGGENLGRGLGKGISAIAGLFGGGSNESIPNGTMGDIQSAPSSIMDAAPAIAAAKGGKISNYDDGGQVDDDDKGGIAGAAAKLLPLLMAAAKGGKVPALVSPGERYLPPEDAKAVAEKKAHPLKAGEKIPGKAKVKGDSLKNDTVPKNLEEGGVVIPRSVMESEDPAHEAYKFVKSVLEKGKK